MPASSFTETLDRDPSTPMYQQIQRELEGQMLSGKLPVGAQVPTEQCLCALHGVSRITARRALEELRKLGLIKRTPGRGSFVCALPQDQSTVATEVVVLTTFTAHHLISASESGGWEPQVVRGMDSCLLAEGFHVTLLPLQFEGSPKDAFTLFCERIDTLGPRLAGVIGFGTPSILPMLEALDRRGIPWVTVRPVSRAQSYNFVAADNFESNRYLAEEFLRLGYRKALFVSTDIGYIATADRFFGFLQGWFKAGGRLEDVSRMEVTTAAALSQENMDDLARRLSGKDRPRAIFCMGDLLAASVLKICQQQGLSVPEDVAVVGGSGLTLAEHTTPTLTVLAQPTMEIGHAAESMLVEIIRTKQLRIPGRYIPCPIIRRDSCPIGFV